MDEEIERKLRLNMKDKILETRFEILKSINFQSYSKTYKPTSVKRVFIPKKYNGEIRPIGIPTIKDRTVQQVIYWAIFPIAEYQADCLSFAFRPKRSARNAIKFITRLLIKSRITRKHNQ
jgi:retron-type reverse transcriptase